MRKAMMGGAATNSNSIPAAASRQSTLYPSAAVSVGSLVLRVKEKVPWEHGRFRGSRRRAEGLLSSQQQDGPHSNLQGLNGRSRSTLLPPSSDCVRFEL